MTGVRAPSLVAFDVNETLLSLAPMRAGLEAVFGADPPIGEWFARMLHGSLVANETGAYRSFGVIGAEALLTLASKHGKPMTQSEAAGIVATMSELPPHPDVHGAMERLFDSGMPMVTLTNGSTAVATAQVENAGIGRFVQRVISVEEVGKFKPSAAPYRHAADLMGVHIGEMMMVAAHDWDCAGALSAGARSAFVRRPGAVWSLPSGPPELVVEDLTSLADAILG